MNEKPRSTDHPHLLAYVVRPSASTRELLDLLAKEARRRGLTVVSFGPGEADGRRHFQELVLEADRPGACAADTGAGSAASVDPAPLFLDFSARLLRVGEISLTFEPLLLAVYAAFLARKAACPGKECPPDPQETGHGSQRNDETVLSRPYREACRRDCYLSIAGMRRNGFPESILRFYHRIYGWGGQREETMLERLERGLETEAMRQYISKINRQFRRRIADHRVLDHLLITTVGRYGATRYGLRLPRRSVPAAVLE